MTNYRPEIDGLRAIAVLAVVLFHAGVPGFRGGYVGVDVFFVISGYLITRIISSDLEIGRLSLTSFYERRIRRIIPAFLVVSFSCVFLSWWILLPRDMEEMSRSVVASAAFVSNFWIWGTISYFDNATHLKPMMHTWSLAVEEQFYLLYPLAFSFAAKRGRVFLSRAVLVLALLSFTLAEWGAFHSPSAAFYFLPTRGWELLAGACVALFPVAVHSPLRARQLAWLPEVACLLGLLLILAPVLVFDSSTPFPGRFALLPVLGASLFIAVAPGAPRVSGALKGRVVVGVGLLSYSFYLWHQVLFALFRHRSLLVPEPWKLVLVAVFSLALSWVTWRYVERPFRDRSRFTRGQVFASAVLGASVLVATAGAGIAGGGWAFRVPLEARTIDSARADRNPRSAECHSKEGLYISPPKSCIIGNPDLIVGALLGDSHADAIAKELGNALLARGLGMRHMSYSACPPLDGMYRADAGEGHRCAEFNLDTMRFLLREPALRHVVLVARWPLYFEGTRFDNQEGGREWGPPVDLRPLGKRREAEFSPFERHSAFANSVRSTIEQFLRVGKVVTLVYAVPEVGVDVPSFLAKSAWRDGASFSPLTTSRGVYRSRVASVHSVFDALGERRGLRRVRPEALFCGISAEGRCETMAGREVLYFDDNHPSSHGARRIATVVVDGMSDAVESVAVNARE